MKKTAALLPLVLALSLLAACGDTTQPAQTSAPSTKVPQTPQPSAQACVSYSYKYASAAVPLPDGWGYEIEEYEAPDDPDDYSDTVFEIELYPLENPEFELSLCFRAGALGLCGTGVTIEQVELSSGYTATRYTEAIGDGDYWYLLAFNDLPGSYSLECCEISAEFEKYEPIISQIADSAVLAGDIIHESDAEEAAALVYNSSYDSTQTEFDYINGVWTVTFFKDGSTAGSKVLLDYSGRVMDC